MKYFSADTIYSNIAEPLRNHVIITDDTGVIIDVVDENTVTTDVLKIKGAIVPGFINAHCHLELSHLKNQLPTGTGLVDFIKSVVSMRDFPEEEIMDAIKEADREMYLNGIVAVGDISNKADTAIVKSESQIKYYTFIEMFDLLQEDQADKTFKQYMDVYHSHKEINGNKKSCVPHAPYSVSRRLFDLITNQNEDFHTVSLHNQETWHENALFLTKEGEFLNFYKGFGLDLPGFLPTGKKSINYALEQMNSNSKTLFIHNTITEEEDIMNAHKWNSNSYWVTCPNANLFIENQLPNYKMFISQNVKMAIGTDSLSSNWQLSILEELKTIEKYQSYIDPETLVKWSSFYGAEALGYCDLGSIEKGKKPGLVALETDDVTHFKFNNVSRYHRLI